MNAIDAETDEQLVQAYAHRHASPRARPDQRGEPVPGATVLVDGGHRGPTFGAARKSRAR